MSIKRVILTSLFCVAMLFAAGKKAEAAFPYDMEQKPVMAASIKSEKVSVYEGVISGYFFAKLVTILKYSCCVGLE